MRLPQHYFYTAIAANRDQGSQAINYACQLQECPARSGILYSERLGRLREDWKALIAVRSY